MPQGVMVIAEQRDGEIRKVSYEIVSEGKRLADKLGQKVIAVLLGQNIKAKAASLAITGPTKSLWPTTPSWRTTPRCLRRSDRPGREGE